MSLTLESISRGKAAKAPRTIILGDRKTGKSTWAAGAPGVLFLPIKGETGLDNINAAKLPTVGTFEDLMASLEFVYHNHDAAGVRTVCIDSASALEPLVWDKVCRENNAESIEKVNGGFGKGYIEAVRYWRDVLDALDTIRDERGIGCVLVGHVGKPKAFNDPLADPYDTYHWDLQERAANLLERWADSILFLAHKTYTKTVAVGEQTKQKGAHEATKKTTHGIGQGERVIYTDKRPGHPGGNRYGLPYEMKPSYREYADAVAASLDSTNNSARG